MTVPALERLSAEEKRALLARLLEERRRSGAGPGGPRRCPLSFAQNRLWFLAQLEPRSAAFNISSAVRLLGRLEAPALARALDRLAARHETLRTAVVTVEGRGLQEVHGRVRPPFARVDLTALPAARRDRAASALALADARRPFDLDRAPLWRLTLARLGPDDHALVLTMHHIVSDGLSMEVLTRELVELYRAEREARPPALPPRTLQYAGFAAWQRQALAGEGRLAGQLAYWRDRLAGVEPYLELPEARPRERVRADRGRRRSRRIERPRLERLRALARAEGTTLFVLVLTGFQIAIGSLTGRRDFLVGAPFAGRNSTELEGMIGFLLNLVPLRADLEGSPSLLELVRRTRRTALEAQENQDLPFDAMVDDLGLARSQDHSPLVQITCDVQTASPPMAERVGGLELRPLASAPGAATELAQFDLSLNAMVHDDRMPIHLTYRSDLYPDATVERLLDRLEGALDALASRPRTALAALESELARGDLERGRRREREALSARREKFGRLRRRSAATADGSESR